MKKLYLIAGAVILVIIGGAIFRSNQSGFGPAPSQSGSSGTQTTPSSSIDQTQKNQTSSNLRSTSTSVVNTTPSAVSEKYTIHANDFGADLTRILVLKGDIVQITFVVNATGTYRGGLDFRSSVVNTGPISPGSSKTIVFTAMQPFAFTPYWPSTNIQKPYTITVGVGIP